MRVIAEAFLALWRGRSILSVGGQDWVTPAASSHHGGQMETCQAAGDEASLSIEAWTVPVLENAISPQTGISEL